jgi:hypothetical protein
MPKASLTLAHLTLSAVLALAAAQGARAQGLTVLSGPTVFYKYGSNGAPASSDVPGCGTSTANACKTCNYLYSQLLGNYMLAPGGSIAIQLSGNTHTDTCAFTGRMIGQSSPRQIVIVGGGANAASGTDCTSPDGSLMSPASGDAFSAAFDAEYSIYCLEAENNSGGQGVFTTGQGGRLVLRGQIVSLGSGNPAGNDLTSGIQSLIEIATPTTTKDAFGLSTSGLYYFDGPGQCAFDAGDQGEIIADGNGQPGVFTFHWNGQTYSAGTGCANDHGVVQLENITHDGTVCAREYDILTGGTIDAASFTSGDGGLPHSKAGVFTPDPGFTGP